MYTFVSCKNIIFHANERLKTIVGNKSWGRNTKWINADHNYSNTNSIFYHKSKYFMVYELEYILIKLLMY